MIKDILLVILFIFGISGLCEFIHSVRLFFIMPKRKCNSSFMISLDKGYAVSELKFIIEQSRWLGDLYASRIFAFTDDIDGEELELCKIEAENSDVILCRCFEADIFVNSKQEKING